MRFKYQGKLLPQNEQFTIGESQYPSNWLSLSTVSERLDIGIEDVIEQARPNDQFYFVTDNGDGTYASIPRSLVQLKESAVQGIKETAIARLNMTAWYIERLMDPSSNKPVPGAVITERASIRERADQLEQMVNGCQSIDDLAAAQIKWDEDTQVTQ